MVRVAHVLVASPLAVKPSRACLAFEFRRLMILVAAVVLPSLPSSREGHSAGVAFIIPPRHEILCKNGCEGVVSETEGKAKAGEVSVFVACVAQQMKDYLSSGACGCRVSLHGSTI